VGFVEKLNVGTPPSVPSLALGASEVTLLGLTSAYGAFAAEGLVRPPVLIRKVVDTSGNVLYEAPQDSHRAVSQATAFLISSMLADVVNAGTGYRARQAGFTRPAAGKTGTTNDYVDAWFVGYTPRRVTGVWIGFDQPKTIVANGYGGELAVPIWAAFMKTATRGDKPDWFERPRDVIGLDVCRVSGRRANVGCGSVVTVSSNGVVETRSQVYTEYFVKGTEPKSACPIHTSAYLETLSAVATTGELPPGVTAVPTSLPPGTSIALPGAVRESGKAGASEKTETAGTTGAAETKEKRGFWSRLFGLGDKDKDDKKKPPKKPDGKF
jgi:membrane peptidoglycan carboxypeptidase